MSHWYDFGTVLPPAGLMVRLRRHPEHNPPYFGAFDIPTGIATSKVDIGYALLTPWQALTHWTVLQGSPGAWPQPHTGSTPWRDPFWTPPTDGQSVWLRRHDTDTASIMANYRHAQQTYAIHDTPWQLPWYCVWKWKPR
jgi:hypothetical protein